MSRLNTFLTGVRVLDMSQYISGPMAALFLAEMGAEVLKIEPPTGDAMASLGPRDASGRPVFYQALNAGKNVRRIDLKSEAGHKEMLGLVETADVLIEGFRPHVMQRLGLDYAVLDKVNPQLIMCSISGYGAGTALSSKPGHDANYLAGMGVLSRNGTSAPMFFDPPVADMSGCLFALSAILAALRDRDRTSRGCAIDLALADSVMPLQLMQVADFGVNGHVPMRGETYLNGGAAYYQIYRTKGDRFIALGSVEPKFWAAFCGAAGHPEWIERHGEPLPQARLIGDVAAYFAGMTLQECVEKFGPVDCCFSQVLDIAEAVGSPYVKERGLVREGADGDLQALFPARIDGELPASRPALRVHEMTDPARMPHAFPRKAVKAVAAPMTKRGS